jgi:hypothetical protein
MPEGAKRCTVRPAMPRRPVPRAASAWTARRGRNDELDDLDVLDGLTARRP